MKNKDKSPKILISSEWGYGVRMFINNKQYEYGIQPHELVNFKFMCSKNKGKALAYLKRIASYCKQLNMGQYV